VGKPGPATYEDKPGSEDAVTLGRRAPKIACMISSQSRGQSLWGWRVETTISRASGVAESRWSALLIVPEQATHVGEMAWGLEFGGRTRRVGWEVVR
jgi:hypothetical protein